MGRGFCTLDCVKSPLEKSGAPFRPEVVMADVRTLYAEVKALREEARKLLSGEVPEEDRGPDEYIRDGAPGFLPSVAAVLGMSLAALVLKQVKTSEAEDLSRECVDMAHFSLCDVRDYLMND